MYNKSITMLEFNLLKYTFVSSERTNITKQKTEV